jgi:hypothetical protein
MNPNQELDQALRVLRSEHRQHGRPPLELERMRSVLYVNAQRAKRGRVVIGLAVAAASIVLLLAYFHPFRITKDPETEPTSLTAFLSLPFGPVLAPSSNTTYVCVRLQKGDLRQFGIDIPEIDAKQIVQAEFALGEDGLARAVRLVGPLYRSGNQQAVVSSR